MADLPEDDTFPAAITQIETTDPVSGGVSGVANRALIQLARRTRWLYNKVQYFLDNMVLATGDYVDLRARATTKEDVGLALLRNYPPCDDPATGTSEQYATGAAVKQLADLIAQQIADAPPSIDDNALTVRIGSSEVSATLDGTSVFAAYTDVPIYGTVGSNNVISATVDGSPVYGAFTIPVGWYRRTERHYTAVEYNGGM